MLDKKKTWHFFHLCNRLADNLTLPHASTCLLLFDVLWNWFSNQWGDTNGDQMSDVDVLGLQESVFCEELVLIGVEWDVKGKWAIVCEEGTDVSEEGHWRLGQLKMISFKFSFHFSLLPLITYHCCPSSSVARTFARVSLSTFCEPFLKEWMNRDIQWQFQQNTTYRGDLTR